MPTTDTVIRCKAQLKNLNDWLILKLPTEASATLPSRGQVMVSGTLNGIEFTTPLEPDGMHGHWFKPEAALVKGLGDGDSVELEFQVLKEWPEPELPADMAKALNASKKAKAVWDSTTPLAHWEWLRWTRGTGNAETRERRIRVGISKLESGERRPCCWNRNACSEPAVSKNGVLIDLLPVKA